jgi:hypothetical protein
VLIGGPLAGRAGSRITDATSNCRFAASGVIGEHGPRPITCPKDIPNSNNSKGIAFNGLNRISMLATSLGSAYHKTPILDLLKRAFEKL